MVEELTMVAHVCGARIRAALHAHAALHVHAALHAHAALHTHAAAHAPPRTPPAQGTPGDLHDNRRMVMVVVVLRFSHSAQFHPKYLL